VIEKTIPILAFADAVLLAFVLLAVRRSVFRLKAELKRSLALREKSDRYREMFEQTEAGVIRSDAGGRIRYINRAGANILGFDRADELYAENITTHQFFSDPGDEARIQNILRHGGSVKNQYHKIKNARGETLYVTGNGREINDESGKRTGFEGFFRDMTRRVTAEKALWNYSEKLETRVGEKTAEILALERKKFELEKRAAVGEMASALVHELRNPLSSLKMVYQTLINRIAMNESARLKMETAHEAGQKVERILKDVLDFARPQELRLIRQELRPILDNTADSFEGEFKSRGVFLRRDYARDLPSAVVDSDQLGRALGNLLRNAAESVRDGSGEIRLSAECLPRRDGIRITVFDNGAGIAGGDLPRVFDPFFTRKESKTGLGLTLVQKVAEAHRGRAAVESTPGKGTTVGIDLPADRP
jgi:PAS domain S-box-containing protein